MNIACISLFPDIIRSCLSDSIMKRAQKEGYLMLSQYNIRDYSTDKNKRVDDTIFGGGPGMLLQAEPVARAIEAAKEQLPEARVIYLSPSGQRFDQEKAQELSEASELILLCGRYEGIDQRVRATMIDEELSIGDYVLSGGEIAAAVVIDATARLLPGVLGNEESAGKESFSEATHFQGEYPQFTKPRNWRGLEVPDALLNGDHAAIETWQREHLPGLSPSERQMLRVRAETFPYKTRRCILRLHEWEDIDIWMEWMNDPEVMQHIVLDPPFSREDEEGFYRSSKANLHMLPLSILDRKTKKPIGTTALTLEAFNSKSADFGILIGDKDFWGQGLCQEILDALCKIAFEQMGLERLSLRVFQEHIAAQKCYERCGFVRVGSGTNVIVKKDGPHSVYYYERLRD